MTNTYLIILGVGGLVFLLGLAIWRILSHLLALPCPPGFIFILESRIMTGVAGPEAIISRAGVKPGIKVLDAGCGPGRLTIPLAEYLGPGGQVVALDVQPAMLSRLGERISRSNLTNIRAVQGQIGEGLLEESAYDRVLLVAVLGEIPDQEAALAEIYHSLVPGGILSITEVLPDPHFQSRKRVQRLGEGAGFIVESAHAGWRSFTLNLLKPARGPAG